MNKKIYWLKGGVAFLIIYLLYIIAGVLFWCGGGPFGTKQCVAADFLNTLSAVYLPQFLIGSVAAIVIGALVGLFYGKLKK